MSDRDPNLLTPAEFVAAGGVDHWRMTSEGVVAVFRTTSLAQGAEFLGRIAGLPGTGPWMPDVEVRHDAATVRLLHVAEDWFGPSAKTVELARGVSAIANEMGLAARPGEVQGFLLIVEALDIPKVMPFWQALLGYVRRPDSPDEDLMDPRGHGPYLWFEQLDAPRDQRNTMHVACWVPPEEAEARVAAALAAGGRVVRDESAPMWWTLADPEGNEADVATAQGRA
jgi:4a-hydroxytetrahydrobiopterin dehydratase